jgi:hypothetical protein
MGIISSLQVFARIYVLTGGGPNYASYFYNLYLYDNAFSYFKLGLGSAQAWILFVAILLLTLVTLKTSGRWVCTVRWCRGYSPSRGYRLLRRRSPSLQPSLHALRQPRPLRLVRHEDPPELTGQYQKATQLQGFNGAKSYRKNIPYDFVRMRQEHCRFRIDGAAINSLRLPTSGHI